MEIHSRHPLDLDEPADSSHNARPGRAPLKHGADIGQAGRGQCTIAAGDGRKQLEQPVLWDVPVRVEGSPRGYRAWPPAWPSPSGPLGRQRSPALKGGSEIVSA